MYSCSLLISTAYILPSLNRYAPAYERYGSQISALHFIGPNKPWNALPNRPPFAGRQLDPSGSSQRAYDYQSLVDRWFDVYDRHYRAHTPEGEARFEVKSYPSAWDRPTKSGQPAQSSKSFDLEELKRLAIGGLTSSNPETRLGEGHYQSMPLEGRIDLMRPRKPVSEEGKLKVQQPSLPPMQTPPEDWDGFPSESFSYDEALSTPLARQLHLDEHGRWRALPTSAPHEIPGGPRMGMVALPFTPTPLPAIGKTAADFYASESESEGLLLARPPSPHHQDHQHGHRGDSPIHHPHPHQYHPPHDPEQKRDKQHYHTGQGNQQGHGDKPAPHQAYQSASPQLHAPQRTMSPPLLSWNPALEPPPSDAPPGAFPSDTYFANVWDQTPSRQNDLPPGLSPPDLSRLFHPPPTPGIPASLVKEGHYRNVTGDNQAITPSPDRKKVKSIFPWEEKLRPLPGRVFPDLDAPPPSLFLSPGSQSQTSTTTPSTPEMRRPSRTLPLSPLHILPNSLSFANAWDTVPSIQKYATRLVKPPPPPPLAPAFEDENYRKGRRKSRDDRSEVNSQDGDDEDNADDEDEVEPTAPSTTKWDDEDESDREKARRRSRRGSVVSASLKPTGSSAISATKKPKRYKDQGVQTTIVEKRSQGIQVDPPKPDRNPKRVPMMGKRYWPPATTTDTSMIARDDPPGRIVAPQPLSKKKSPTSSPPSHSPVKLVREFISPPPVKIAEDRIKPSSPPLMKPSMKSTSSSTLTGIAPLPPQPLTALSGPVRSRASSLRSSTSSIARQTSNDSSLGSPASSYGPLSPLDVQSILPPARKSVRVWDPARGVELFKKGSEEVLARFLRMGSFDEETH